ncbi:unnamed protein product [Phytophthora fragariaefolia]|uniref:Unnamed protein product n=1 Tax=Phytophthora fragariaefolia TaxID=1490495 RepID=A0A9W6XJ62_9STRA|nr:unnamed protein product [Phytophthora fragariaefolia]
MPHSSVGCPQDTTRFGLNNATTPPVALPAVSASGTTSTSARLSVSDYFAKHRRRHGPSPMENAGDGAYAPRRPLRACDLLFEDSEEEGEVQVDYGESPDEAPGSSSQSTSATPASPARDASPRVLCTPNSFPERPAGLLALCELSEPRDPLGSAMEEPVVTNDLDKAQSRQVAHQLQAPVTRRPVARPLLTPSVRKYGFQPRDPVETACQAASQLLNTYVIGPAARTREELAQRTALRERFLTPQVTILSEYVNDCESRASEVRCRPCGLILWFFNLGMTLRSMILALSFGWRSLGDLVPWRLFELASQKWMLV